MQFIVEYLPLIAFFIAYKLADIYVATTVAIVGAVLTIAYSYFKTKQVSTMQWLTLVIVGVFGGATLFLHDERFIKWKPSVLYALFAAILLYGRVVKDKDFIKSLLEQAQINMPKAAWVKITWLWIGFFTFLTVLNGYVAAYYPLDVWVNFKVWGVMGLTLVFMVIVVAVMMKQMQDPSKANAIGPVKIDAKGHPAANEPIA
jgi:intracellular septation protein